MQGIKNALFFSLFVCWPTLGLIKVNLSMSDHSLLWSSDIYVLMIAANLLFFSFPLPFIKAFSHSNAHVSFTNNSFISLANMFFFSPRLRCSTIKKYANLWLESKEHRHFSCWQLVTPIFYNIHTIYTIRRKTAKKANKSGYFWKGLLWSSLAFGAWLAGCEGTMQHLQVVTPNKSMIRSRTPAALPT